MEFKEIEQKLWLEFLNRLQVEKNASPSKEVTFLLDMGSYEGVRLYDFQDKALAKLLSLGAITSMREYRHQTPLMRMMEDANPLITPSRPDGYVIHFSDGRFNPVLAKLRHSLARGDIHEEPVFELGLDKLKLTVLDLETGKKYVIHKMKLDSLTQDIFEYIFQRQCFDVEKEELAKSRIEITKGLNSLINAIRLPSTVRNAFFNVSRNRLIVYSVIFKKDLEKLDIDIERLRKELNTCDKD